MSKELCGLVRCFRIREKAKLEITTESPLLPWLVRHCGWTLSRYAVRAVGRTGYSRLKGREYTSGIATLGEEIWIWLGKSDRSDEHIIRLENGAVLSRSVRRKVEGKRWNERALKMVTGMESSSRRSGGETTVHHTSFGGEIRSNRRLWGVLPKESATLRTIPGTV